MGCGAGNTPPGPDGSDAAGIWADSVCGEKEACECEGHDPEACRTRERDDFTRVQEAAEAAGLTFDPDCVAHHVEDRDTPDCAGEERVEGRPACEQQRCQLFHGTAQFGERCEDLVLPIFAEMGLPSFVASTCAQGLRCTFERCWDFCISEDPRAGGGEECRDGIPTAYCEDDLFCNEDDPGTCEPSAGPMESCRERPCDHDHYCDPAYVCKPRPGVGSSCTGNECELGLTCRGGTCEPVDTSLCGA